MIKVWLIFTSLFGTPMPVQNSPEFPSEWLCMRKLMQMGPATESFKLQCIEVTKEERDS